MKFIHGKMTFIHMKSFIYGHIHPCRCMKITLNFKFQAQVLCSYTSHHSFKCVHIVKIVHILK